jgi:uncharacterized iron-regulated membrane protein
METLTVFVAGISALVFIFAGVYLHILRKRAERIVPAPFLNPSGKRKPRKRR